VKAIKTKYGSYTFRSRTEARWAAFFDAFDVKWQYEPQGYVLNNGKCYLPDFYIAGFGFVEVKAALDDESFDKIKCLYNSMQESGCEYKNQYCLLLSGIPRQNMYQGYLYFSMMDEDSKVCAYRIGCLFYCCNGVPLLKLHDESYMLFTQDQALKISRQYFFKFNLPEDAFEYAMGQQFENKRGKMARINLEDDLWIDSRLVKANMLATSRYTLLESGCVCLGLLDFACHDLILGACIRAWKLAQKYWVRGENPEFIPIEKWGQGQFPKELFEVGLAVLVENGQSVYMSGSEEQFHWLTVKKKNGGKGGTERARKAKEKQLLASESKQSQAKSSKVKQSQANLPSSSSSSSSSNSFSFSEENTNTRKCDWKIPASADAGSPGGEPITHLEPEALKKSKGKKRKEKPDVVIPPDLPFTIERAMQIWNENKSAKQPGAEEINQERVDLIGNKMKTFKTEEQWIAAVKNIASSEWHNGMGSNKWKAKFEWFLSDKGTTFFEGYTQSEGFDPKQRKFNHEANPATKFTTRNF
jgi:hypothetical protein